MNYEILKNPRTADAIVFEEDFERVASYFSDILETGSWSALPGGVIDTFVPSSSSYQTLTLEADDFRGYRVDAGRYIASNKHTIATALSVVENRHLCDADFTLCPSVSFGLLAILMALKREGVRTVVAELPAYFACIEQALALDFRVLLWPTLAEDGYAILPSDVRKARACIGESVALLITQPRYGMGFCRHVSTVAALRNELRPNDVLVIDEAADQDVPAGLSGLSLDGEVTVLRARGLTKGLGLNSARVGAIFHPHRLRPLFGEIVDFAGGALDTASLLLVTRLSTEPSRYVDLLRAAQAYVRQQNSLLRGLLAGLPISLSPIESGYIGTAHIFLPRLPGDLDEARQRFLTSCRLHRMPVVLGSSMYFPYVGDREIIRINYFTTEHNIRASATILGKIMSVLSQGS